MTSRWADPPSLEPDDSTASSLTSPPPPPPHPTLLNPVLHVGGITQAVSDETVVSLLSECLRVRPKILRESGSSFAPATGVVEFESLDRAEKAYATVNGQLVPDHSCSLLLTISPSPSSDPIPSTTPQIFKSLPQTTTSGQLFDLCRPFGPIYSVSLQLAPAYPPGSGPPTFKGQALVTFYCEEHAKVATEELHCAEVEGTTIIVQLFEASRAARRSDVAATAGGGSPSSWAGAQPFSPGTPTSNNKNGHPRTSLNAVASPWTPEPAGSRRSFSSASQVSVHATPPPPFRSPSANSNGGSPIPAHLVSAHGGGGGGVIDPCNLFIKSLDPTMTTSQLSSFFSPFGSIVSARVMTDERGLSKEFGFVSFEKEEEAKRALLEMDGKTLLGKTVTVRLHEPKKYREGRLAAQGMGMRRSESSSSGNGLSEVEKGFKGLSTSATPSPSRNDDPSTTTTTSPLLARSTPGTTPATSPTAPLTPASERERLIEAVQKLEPTKYAEIVDLLLGLPKKERALSLFNPEYLRLKVSDALEVLEAPSDDEQDTTTTTNLGAVAPAPSSPTPSIRTSLPPTTTEPALELPSSLAALAQLPADEIISLLPSLAKEGKLGIKLVEEEKKEETENFMDGLEGKAAHEIKQKLGERLFKAVKATGSKGAPRITIALLDSEPLRPLAHLINYPEVLKEKVALHVTPPASSNK